MLIGVPSVVRLRRLSPVAERPDEGPLTEPTTDAQPWPWEPVVMPHFCPLAATNRVVSGGRTVGWASRRFRAVHGPAQLIRRGSMMRGRVGPGKNVPQKIWCGLFQRNRRSRAIEYENKDGQLSSR